MKGQHWGGGGEGSHLGTFSPPSLKITQVTNADLLLVTINVVVLSV